MRLYLDTVIVNDIWVIFQADSLGQLRPRDVKRPLKKWVCEYVALYYLLDLDEQWDLEFGSSPVMFEEISRMPIRDKLANDKKKFLFDTYELLKQKVPPYELTAVPEGLYNKVAPILPHRNDVSHICQMSTGRWDYFITTDCISVLRHAERLRRVGINATSPRTFIEKNFLTLEQLVRTLHGSWTRLEDIVRLWMDAIESST